MDSGILRRAAELVVAAAIGAGLTLGGVAVFAGLDGHTTTVREIVSGGPTSAPASFRTGRPLSINQIYRSAAPGVVQVTSTSVVRLQNGNPFGFDIPGFSFPQEETQRALGSGFVIDKAGHIVTNYHVVAGAQRVQVSFSSADQINATVVGKDPSTDVAVLKIDTHSRALTPLQLGNSDAVHVGDTVYAIGNPFGYARTLTSGLVSAVQRQITAPNSLPIDGAIQTDAAINHGNSGGPLIDAAGRVIGVTSQISTGTTGQQGNLGIGFAIPINTVRNVAAQIIQSGKVEHAYIGVSTTPITPQLARVFNLPTTSGLLVDTVTNSSGADKAGLRGGRTNVIVQGNTYTLGGDIIVEADGQPISTYDQLRSIVAKHKPGEKLTLGIYRQGHKKSVSVTLGEAPK